MVMLAAGGVYCLLGILYQIPLMDFMVQLLIVLLAFWILGGIVRLLLDKFMGEIDNKAKEEEAEEKDADGESEESEASEETTEEAEDLEEEE